MSGSVGHYDTGAIQRDFAKAQKDAAELWGNPEAVKRMISDQWAYEKIGLAAAVPGAGRGLVGVTERVRVHGGTLELRNAAPGLLARVRWPL